MDYYENREITRPLKTANFIENNNNLKNLNPDSPENLTHTKIINGKFGNQNILNWNKLVDVAHIQAMNAIGDFSDLANFSISGISKGRRSDKGFRFLPEIGISIQGENANHAWKSALHLAKKLRLK